MTRQLLVIFGKPGAGKSYVADIAARSFGYFSHNGDDDLPAPMKELLLQKGTITDTMRKKFAANMIATVQKLSKKHENLIVHQTFLKEFMRIQILNAFPYAKFILVKSDDAVREQRYLAREYFNLGLSYLRHMTDLFEPVQIPHTVLKNNSEGPTHIVEQLKNITRGNL